VSSVCCPLTVKLPLRFQQLYPHQVHIFSLIYIHVIYNYKDFFYVCISIFLVLLIGLIFLLEIVVVVVVVVVVLIVVVIRAAIVSKSVGIYVAILGVALLRGNSIVIISSNCSSSNCFWHGPRCNG